MAGFAKNKTEKLRLSRKVRAQVSQYMLMQREDIRDHFPDWFEREWQALLSAQVALESLIGEHNREVDRRERQRIVKAVTGP